MYITAHRAQSEDKEGINAFFHLHGLVLDWSSEAWRIPEVNPGRELLSSIEIEPGGNTVRSYLDIIAQDRCSSELIRDALSALRIELSIQPNPVVYRYDQVILRFGVELCLKPAEELDILFEAIWPLLQQGLVIQQSGQDSSRHAE